MSPTDWTGVVLAALTVIGSFIGAVKWLVKHYLNELKPNSGSSLKDSVTRLEEKVEILYQIMLQRGGK